jgi:hypothetical protein
MAGQLRIDAPRVVTVGQAFDCVVQISGAMPGETVTVALRQLRGTPPFLDERRGAPIDHLGNGTASFFALALAGPSTARLVADGASALSLAGDDALIRVLP